MGAAKLGAKAGKAKEEYTGRPGDFWRMHGWRRPLHFLHAVIYYGNTRRYVHVLTVVLTYVMERSPKFLNNSAAYKWLLNWLPRRYHGKVLTCEHAAQILTLNQDVHVQPDQAKRVLTYDMVNQIVLKNPNSVAVGDCACRVRRENPCTPYHVCMFVGEPFATYAVQHGREKLNIHYVTQEEALAVLQRAHEAGYVHNAFFKDAAGDRLFAICNCCLCCCGGMQAQSWFRDFFQGDNPELKMLESSGYVAVHDPDKCQGCGQCVEACGFLAVKMEDGRPVVEPDRCLGCGICADKCPSGAIVLNRDYSKPEPLDLSALETI